MMCFMEIDFYLVAVCGLLILLQTTRYPKFRTQYTV